MMKRLVLVVLMTIAMVLPEPGRCSTSEVKLRGWYFSWQTATGQRSRYDVFGKEQLPTGMVEEKGWGAGILLGHRFGDRFLLGLQVVYAQHDISGGNDQLVDAEALITGTVLFRQTSTLQPFLRGGFGASSEIVVYDAVSGKVVSYGTAAIAGGGLQVRLSSRFSLELETVATFANFLEVNDSSELNPWTEEKWQVRTSNYGLRIGLGVVVWF